MPTRCPWVGDDPAMQAYHDEEWGVPVHNDRRFFQDIVLDGMQAGLSWAIVLRKRDAFRKAFADFDPEVVAAFGESAVAELLANPGIIRNRAKIRATIGNARAFLTIQEEFGSFDRYIWRFVDGTPIRNSWSELAQLPAKSAESDAASRDLKARGFRFVGSTIVYAFMQATGLVNDHLVGCFRHHALEDIGSIPCATERHSGRP